MKTLKTEDGTQREMCSHTTQTPGEGNHALEARQERTLQRRGLFFTPGDPETGGPLLDPFALNHIDTHLNV